MSVVPLSGRVYGYVMPGTNGRMLLRFTRTGDTPETATAQLVTRG